ncbi:phosphatidylglycerol lysyltransferase [Bacillus australimaris]|uniref:Phosphatidylglycerol lysyltransferase n=1 Tax=Bacillus australimaris TaxID=1326968 RepID=A0ABD4QQ35_9BACI|nr:bifunctional lysylphosphatidylglycerol flippase/synthetase MprF [Bacillus australimaris]KPN12714.1 phosphatidylglycerol lysyltransferase [Bacillus australimaris]MBR8691657.1 bifunctional lysylphosphatidylglycerol flippase/synthetase MprF [Bacillus australimaris]
MWNKKTGMTILKMLFPIVIILVLIFVAKQELSGLSIKKTFYIIDSLNRMDLFILVFLGLVAVLSMSLYDFILRRSLDMPISGWKTIRISWIANSFNSVLGFGGLSGAGLRTLLYKEYITDTKKLLKGIALLTSSVLLGLSIFSDLILVRVLPVESIISQEPWLWAFVIIFACIVPIYIVLASIRKSSIESGENGLKHPIYAYIGASFLEWLAAGLVMYMAVVSMGMNVDVRIVLGVFAIASIGGLISMVPGGFGSFDLIFLLSMQYIGFDKEMVLTALVLYRFVYSIFPFILGLCIAAYDLTGTTLRRLEGNPRMAPAIETTNVLIVLHRALLIRLLYGSLSILTFGSGLLIMASVVLPVDRLGVITSIPHFLLSGFNGLSLMFGIILMILSIEVYKRTKRSYALTMISLAGGFVFTLLKGFNLSLIFILPVIMAVFFSLRSQFVKQQAPYSLNQFVAAAAGYLFVLFNYNVIGNYIWTKIGHFLSKDYLVHNERHITMTSIIALIGVPLFFFISKLIFNKKAFPIGEEADEEKLKSFLEEKGGNALSHLGFLGDKKLFFSSDGEAMLQFGRIGRCVIVLGDPSGRKSSYPLVLEEFLQQTEKAGYRVAFYQVEREGMALYHDLGFHFFKLGEEAMVDLETFSLSGKKKSNLRAVANKFEREGYTFDMLEPPFSDELISTLKQISNSWLGKKKEKGFSLGYFQEDYLQKAPIAILKDDQGQIISFVSLMPMYQEGEISIDLMRHMHDAPNGMMDALFIHLFQWAKEKGYKSFNMGMAPLSNVGTFHQSFLTERLASVIFNNVRYMYSFSGLRSFKQKYKPEWRGKYLAYKKNTSLPVTMVLVTKLIGMDPNRNSRP